MNSQSTASPQSSSGSLAAIGIFGGGGFAIGAILSLVIGSLFFLGGSDSPSGGNSANSNGSGPNNLSGVENAMKLVEFSDGPFEFELEAAPKVAAGTPSRSLAREEAGRRLGGMFGGDGRSPNGGQDLWEIESPVDSSAFEIQPVKTSDKIQGFEFPGPLKHVAYDGKNRRIACISDKAGITVYSLDEMSNGKYAPLFQQALPEGAGAICLKNFKGRRFYIVGSKQSPTLLVIDADGLTKSGEVPLKGPSGVTKIVTGKNPNDPFIYMVTTPAPDKPGRVDGPWQARLCRYDLSKKSLTGPSLENFYDLAVSDDGLQFIGRRQRNCAHLSINPRSSALDVQQVVESNIRNGKYRYLGPSFGFSSSYRGSGDLAGAVLRTRGLLCKWDRREGLVFEDLEQQQKSVASFKLPSKFYSPVVDFLRISKLSYQEEPCTEMVYDQENEELLLFTTNMLAIAKLADMELPEPKSQLAFDMDLPSFLPVGREFNLAMDGLAEGTKVAFEHRRQPNSNSVLYPEKGQLILNGTSLTWKPMPSDLGKHEIVLRLENGARSRAITWKPTVSLPSFQVPIFVSGIRTDPAGKIAVVWGSRNSLDNNKQDLAVVQMASGTVAGSLRLPDGNFVRDVAIDGGFIFVLSGGNNKVMLTKYSVAGLKPVAESIVSDSDRVRVLGNTLVVTRGYSNTGSAYFAANLKADNEFYNGKLTPDDSYGNSNEPVMIGDGLFSGAVLWDRTRRVPKLLVRPIDRNGAGSFRSNRLENVQITPTMGGPHYFVGSRSRSGLNIRGSEVFSNYPAWYRASGNVVQVSDFANPETLKTAKVDFGEGVSASVANTKDSILAAHGNRIYRAPLKLLFETSTPFRIQEKQSTFTLGASGTNRIKYVAPGADSFVLRPYVSRSSSGENNMRSSKTGSFSFRFNEEETKQLVYLARNACGLSLDGTDVKKVDEYAKKVQPLIAKFSRKRITGVPVSVPVQVLAYHKDGQQVDGITHYYIVDVPKQLIFKK